LCQLIDLLIDWYGADINFVNLYSSDNDSKATYNRTNTHTHTHTQLFTHYIKRKEKN